MSLLEAGDVAPWFQAPVLGGRPDYRFDTAGGRCVVMLFTGGVRAIPPANLELVGRYRDRFDDRRAIFFGLTRDPQDVSSNAIGPAAPGLRWFLDFDGRIATLYGSDPGADPAHYWLLLDPMLRVVLRTDLGDEPRLFEALDQLLAAPPAPPPPVLVTSGVFEPELCRELIDYFERMDPVSSGVMDDAGGQLVERSIADFKVRQDVAIKDPQLQARLTARLSRRLCPLLHRVFQFETRYIERWLLARYDAEQHAHFNAHRDNTTAGTAHRKFACTINLNPGDYEGGDLTFPEFGHWAHRGQAGDAVTFSGSLMHEVEPVRRGTRYAFLTFFYDEDGAQKRRANG